jgi:hypothetical protein
MVTSSAKAQAGRPGRKPSLNAEHTAVLRAITQEQPRSSLDEVTRELFRRTGTKVNPVTVRKTLRQAGIERQAAAQPGIRPQVGEALPDRRPLQERRDDLQLAAVAARAAPQVDVEHALEQPRPADVLRPRLHGLGGWAAASVWLRSPL